MNAGDVLPDHPLGAIAFNESKKREGEVATRVCQSGSEAGNGETLARGSADEKVNSNSITSGADVNFDFDTTEVKRGAVIGIGMLAAATRWPLLKLGDVAIVRCVGVVMFQDGAGELLDL